MAATNDESKHLIINGKNVSEDGSAENNLIPKGALVYNGHSYYIYSNVAKTWEAAEAYCEARGGHLAVINDVAENSALYNYKVKMGHGSAFFGLTDAGHEGTWIWVTGEPVTYTNWYKGYPSNEPNNGLGGPVENYADLWSGTNLTRNHAYTWNDGVFSKGAPFICEWDKLVFGFTENDDTCENSLDGKKLAALGGNDEISSTGDRVTIDGGKDDDLIYNSGAKVSINGGAGEGCDTVENYGDEASIVTGAGMDTILNLGNDVSINAGVGNDTIHNDGNNGKGGVDVTIIGGKGDDSIINSGTFASIDGGSNNDTIINSGDDATIDGFADNDLINNGGTPELYGGKYFYRGSNVSINGGAGKNTINNGLYDGEVIGYYDDEAIK